MSALQDDLDLLLSLQDRVLETPPRSPSPANSLPPLSPLYLSLSLRTGYLSDDGLPKRMGQSDMSVFRDAVEDCLDYDPEPSKKAVKAPKANNTKSSSDYEVEKFSGLRIRNQLLTRTELSDRFSDIRFIRLPALKKMLVGDNLPGCWATAGVLIEKGEQRTSSTGKPFCIWKLACLDEKTASVFLFGNAFQRNRREEIGTVFGLFSCSVRKDTRAELGFSLSVFSAPQVLKIGTSADFGVCKACPALINKRRGGIYCKYHKKKTTEKYSTKRTEYKGGNLKTAFRDNYLKSEGIYVVEPPKERTNLSKSMQPAHKLHSVDALKKALSHSNAPKVTTNAYSQGTRFLTEITGKWGTNKADKDSAVQKQPTKNSEKRERSSSTVGLNPLEVRTSQPPLNAKRVRIEPGQISVDKSKRVEEKMIELEFVSSDSDDDF